MTAYEIGYAVAMTKRGAWPPPRYIPVPEEEIWRNLGTDYGYTPEQLGQLLKRWRGGAHDLSPMERAATDALNRANIIEGLRRDISDGYYATNYHARTATSVNKTLEAARREAARDAAAFVKRLKRNKWLALAIGIPATLGAGALGYYAGRRRKADDVKERA